jgi:hypothetical protein
MKHGIIEKRKIVMVFKDANESRVESTFGQKDSEESI